MQDRGAIAIVGASESTLWTYWLMRNIREYAYPGDVWPVNPNRDVVYGLPCHPSIEELPGTPGLAVVMTNSDRAVQATRALAAAGTREVVVVSDGFRETATDEGRARERALQEIGEQTGVRIVGPNCVGFASFHDQLCAIAEPIPLGLLPGSVSVISQSGVLTHTALAALKDEGLGVDVCYSIGNGATFGFEQALASTAQRPMTRIVCAVVESIRDRDALTSAVAAGRADGVEFVFLLLGQSEDGKRVAQSHTGAVVGDQRVMRAWLSEQGVVVVTSFEELTRSAALLSSVGRPGPGRGVFILTGSGGGAGLAADTAAHHGLRLAQLSETTTARIKKHVLPGTVVGNPLDVTTHGGPESTRAIYDLVAADPGVGILIDPYGLSWPDDTDERRWHRAGMETMISAAGDGGVGLVFTSLMGQPITDFMRRLGSRPRVSVNVGLATTISSLAKLYDHDHDAAADVAVAPSGSTPSTTIDVVDEARARDVLAGLGLPVVRGRIASEPDDAVRQAEELHAPWVVKLSLAGLGHKGRVGGVRLGLCSPQALKDACSQIATNVAEAGLAAPADVSFMVQEMEFGPELLVSAVRDRVAGPSLILGVGGWAAETATFFAIIPLPSSAETIAGHVARSALPRLLGAAATAPVAALLHQLGEEFSAGRLQEFSVVECNPVIVTRAGPLIADALLVKNSL